MIGQQGMSDAKRRLLEKLLRGEVARQNWEIPIEPRAVGTPAPIAPAQHLVWLSSQMTASLPVYNEPITVHHRGPLDRIVLERAFNEIVRRHEILRTSFASVDGQVVQVVHHDVTIEMPFLDLTALPENEREAEARRIAVADAQRLFDLAVGPLLRARLVKIGEEFHRLYLTLHHIIFDGVSIYRILLPELAAIYNAFAAEKPSPLSEPRLQYSDFAIWQKRMLDNDSVVRQMNYWRERLAGELPDLQLPSDRPRPAVRSHRGGMKTFSLSSELRAAVKEASHAENVTIYMFLLAVFKTLLHRYSGQEDILVGGVSDGRRRSEFERTAGHFSSNLVLRTHPSGEKSFREFLAEVKDAVLGALANSDVPFDQIVRELHPKRDTSRHPFFQVSFAIEPPMEPIEPWRPTQMETCTGFAKLDLYLEMDERPEGLIARFVYSSDLFDDSTIERMTWHWITLLESAVHDPGSRLCDLAMLTLAEEHQLRVVWNNTRRDVPHATIHELFEQQVKRTPNAVAVEASGERLTYKQLNERANRLARRLRKTGVKAETMVVLCVDRSVHVIAAPLAILKAGGAYLPLDPAFPKERLAYLVEDAQAPILLTERSLEEYLPNTGAQVIYCDEGERDGSNLEPASTPENLAYVLYTSGSTGRPKGVEIPHAALVNLLLSMRRKPGFAKSDSLLAVTTLSFDIAALELYLPLITGGRLVIASRDEARDPRLLMERLRSAKCTVLQATPAAWRALLDAGWSGQHNLKALCGGEALPGDLAEQLLPRVAELWNLYGPTETTVWSTVQRVTSSTGPMPIGRPIDNTDVYILDAHRKLLPAGAVGELYIGGAGVARGYLRRPELTSERFVAHPFQTNSRLYRTGDLARWLPDGTLECLGRVDHQMKIRGFRIEPGEIEAALLEHEGVRAAAVCVWPDASGNFSVAAYTVGAEEADLRRFLQQKLPEHMIPARFVTLDALPLTPNGKVDRKALPEPSCEQRGHHIAPRNDLEQRLAAIWEAVLNVKRIGVDDNFFDLGGHSFLVAKLLRRIDAEFGARLSMAAVFQAPTVARLAELLDDAASIARMPRTVTLQSSGTRTPMFWIYGGPLFRPLANHLGANRPFLGVRPDRAEEEQLSLRFTAEEIARTLTHAIRATQPHGPYFLGGWCVSGIIAYEVAQQLIAAGEEVAQLVMLDAVNPTHCRAIPKRRILWSKTKFHLKKLLRGGPRQIFSSILIRSRGLGEHLLNRPIARASFEAAMLEAATNYDPKPLAARILAVQSVDQPDVWDLSESWSALKNQIDVQRLPGDHVSVLKEPYVGELAARIQASLREAENTRVQEQRRAIAG